MNDLEYFRKFFEVDTVLDRTGLAKTLPLDIDHQIPSDTSKTVSLEDCITNSVNRIKELDKELRLLWSGGIDSTLVFYSLLRESIPFSVVLNEDSKLEHPILYNKIVEGVFPDVSVIHTKKVLELSDSPDVCYITGELGDQMCGSSLYERYSKEKRDGSYERFLDARIIRMTKDSVVSVLGDQDFTTAEYIWAVSFIFKFGGVALRMKIQGRDIPLHHFFNSDTFQIWAIQNYKTNTSFVEWKDYKIPFKTYIYEQDGNEDYFINKTKEPSLKNASLINSDVEWSYD